MPCVSGQFEFFLAVVDLQCGRTSIIQANLEHMTYAILFYFKILQTYSHGGRFAMCNIH